MLKFIISFILSLTITLCYAQHLEWVKYIGNDSDDTYLSSLTVDENGNVYYAGRFGNSSNNCVYC